MKKDAAKVNIGEFNLSSDTYFGKLKVDGENTELFLSSRKKINLDSSSRITITGLLSDNKKVSLIDCITVSRGTLGYDKKYGVQNVAKIFPHFIVSGYHHFAPLEKSIFSIEFLIENSVSLFHDNRVFGQILDSDSREVLGKVSEIQNEELELGDHPEIFYYTGKRIIFECKSCLGAISAFNSPTIRMASPGGFAIENVVPMRITFEKPVVFKESLDAFNIVKNYLDLLFGKPQKIEKIKVFINSDKEYPECLDVYSCLQREYYEIFSDISLNPSDILINGGLEPEIFSQVLSSWLERQSSQAISRNQFMSSFRGQNEYSSDRLVVAANMFDILPGNAFGEAVSIPEDLAAATNECKKIFKVLPETSERNSILGALGRIGKQSLKLKVKQRASFVIDEIGDYLPDFEIVINEAINCRNFYVHGTLGKLAPEAVYRFTSFFIDTLEFIYGASDLIEAGWEIRTWITKKSPIHHPFSIYVRHYRENLKDLKISKRP